MHQKYPFRLDHLNYLHNKQCDELTHAESINQWPLLKGDIWTCCCSLHIATDCSTTDPLIFLSKKGVVLHGNVVGLAVIWLGDHTWRCTYIN